MEDLNVLLMIQFVFVIFVSFIILITALVVRADVIKAIKNITCELSDYNVCDKINATNVIVRRKDCSICKHHHAHITMNYNPDTRKLEKLIIIDIDDVKTD